MKKEQSHFHKGILLLILIFVFVSIFNIHIQMQDFTSTVTFEVNGLKEVYAGHLSGNPQKVFCNVPVQGCSGGFDYGLCENFEGIQWQWKSNAIRSVASNYIIFSGFGKCTVEYKYRGLGFTWL